MTMTPQDLNIYALPNQLKRALKKPESRESAASVAFQWAMTFVGLLVVHKHIPGIREHLDTIRLMIEEELGK